jgi:hypothetical protein
MEVGAMVGKLIVVLPYVFVIGGFGVALQAVNRMEAPARKPLHYPLICSLVLTCGFMVWGHLSLSPSRQLQGELILNVKGAGQ